MFNPSRKFLTKPENAPVAIVLGFVTVPIIIGLHSLKQQLMHAPSVVFDKKKRESMFEVEEPDVAKSSSDKFINKSFLRKVGHIQEPANPTMPDPVQRDAFTRYIHTCILLLIYVTLLVVCEFRLHNQIKINLTKNLDLSVNLNIICSRIVRHEKVLADRTFLYMQC